MKQQKPYKMDERIHKWIAENCQKAGFRYPSQFMAHIVENAMKNEYHSLSDRKLEDEIEIGNIASKRRATKFSLIRSPEDLKEDLKGLQELYEAGGITKEQYEKEKEETEEDHKEVVRLYFHAKKLAETRKKLKEQGNR